MKLVMVIQQLLAFQAAHGGAIKVRVAGEELSSLEVVPAEFGLPAYIDFVGK